jgi:hypothetical protein
VVYVILNLIDHICRDRITARDALKHPFLTQGLVRRMTMRGDSTGIDRSGSASPAGGRSSAGASGTHRPVPVHAGSASAKQVAIALAETPMSNPGLLIVRISFLRLPVPYQTAVAYIETPGSSVADSDSEM